MDILRIYSERLLLEAVRYVITVAVVLAVLFLLRDWAKRRTIRLGAKRWHRALADLRNSAISIAIFAVSATAIVYMVRFGIGQISAASWPWWQVFAAAFAMIFAHDAYFYWTHRAMHGKRLFRLFHREHHLSHAPTVFTAYNFSWLEAIVHAAFVPAYLLIFPANVAAVILFGIHQIIRNVFGHSGHELAPTWFARHRATGWLTTTTHHDLHHSEGRYNYGLYFTLWDRLMGTENPRYHARFRQVAKP